MSEIIGNLSLIVNLLVGFAGIILIAMIVIGGFKMGTAQGDSQKFESGKSTLIQAGIGTLVVMFATMGGNYFIAQIGGASGAAQVQQVAMQDVAALEAPQVTTAVAGTTNIGLRVTFTEPVQVLNPKAVRIGTNNMGTLVLMKNDIPVTCAGAATGKIADGTDLNNDSILQFCALSGGTTPGPVGLGSAPEGARAVQFVMGRGGEIKDSDGNNAIVAFAPVPLK
jgi:hypothetical protein